MRRLVHVECIDGLALEADRFAALLDAADPATRVPTCPEWTVKDLVVHLGIIHRWVTRMVRERPAEPILRVEAEYPHPESPGELAGWFREGAAALVAMLQVCDANTPMWAWDLALGVSFWSRRQLHETAMHRIDLALACGMPTELDREIARDSILELLDFIPLLGERVPDLMELRGNGETIGLRATDGNGFGTITLTSNGFQVDDDLDATDASISGSMTDLALTMSRRLPVTDPKINVSGRMDLVWHWIAHSALD
ncbi:MAG: maleylpyruvate isomerase family mycothiol-dependent enzyme [Acidimicrobiia bacterium]